MYKKIWILWAVVLATLAISANAQSITATLTGLVSDAT
jgi:hypothetical protein